MILTEALQLYCKKHKIRVRALAKITGVSFPTINRFLNGKGIESDNFAKILTWAMQPALSDIKRSRNTEE